MGLFAHTIKPPPVTGHLRKLRDKTTAEHESACTLSISRLIWYYEVQAPLPGTVARVPCMALSIHVDCSEIIRHVASAQPQKADALVRLSSLIRLNAAWPRPRGGSHRGRLAVAHHDNRLLGRLTNGPLVGYSANAKPVRQIRLVATAASQVPPVTAPHNHQLPT